MPPSVYGDLLARATNALTSSDGATFAQASAELGRRLVASGFDGWQDGTLPARVRRATDVLRALLSRCVLGKPGPRDSDALAALARSCANADTRAETYGYPTLPDLVAQGSTESDARPDPSRRSTRSRGAPGAATDRRAGPEERERSEPQEGQ
jgi:hypothetical protein